MKTTERLHLKRVAELGCIACFKLGYRTAPAEIHHVRRFGSKRDHMKVIGLCPHHHRTSLESYHLNPKWFTENIGSQEELLKQTNEMLDGKQN